MANVNIIFLYDDFYITSDIFFIELFYTITGLTSKKL